MKLADLAPAVDKLKTKPSAAAVDLRAVAYLASYPELLVTAKAPAATRFAWFVRVATMTYGWMPRVVRLDPSKLKLAADALSDAAEATPQTMRGIDLDALAISVRSVVGASKMLHFVNPAVYPIWDSRIERTRLDRKPSHAHMTNSANYWTYFNEVHALLNDAGFGQFHADMSAALVQRLTHHGLPTHAITKVRAIELAAFELSAPDDE